MSTDVAFGDRRHEMMKKEEKSRFLDYQEHSGAHRHQKTMTKMNNIAIKSQNKAREACNRDSECYDQVLTQRKHRARVDVEHRERKVETSKSPRGKQIAETLIKMLEKQGASVSLLRGCYTCTRRRSARAERGTRM
jgi:hypothetical protein